MLSWDFNLQFCFHLSKKVTTNTHPEDWRDTRSQGFLLVLRKWERAASRTHMVSLSLSIFKNWNASITSCKLQEKCCKISKELFDPNHPKVSPYSSPCRTNMKAHYALVEIYFWKSSYFTGHVVCMSYDMLVTMVKNELSFKKK